MTASTIDIGDGNLAVSPWVFYNPNAEVMGIEHGGVKLTMTLEEMKGLIPCMQALVASMEAGK